MALRPVRVTIRRGTDPSKPRLQYPARYSAKEVDRVGVGPTGVNGIGAYSHLLEHPDDTEAQCIILLPEALAQEYALDPDMEIITEAQADADMEQWRQDQGRPAEVVRDSARIAAIQAKGVAGIPLTQEDMDALDPEKEIPGVNKALRPVSRFTRRRQK